VGLQLPKRMPLSKRDRWRRGTLVVAASATLLAVSGCSAEDVGHLGFPKISEGATNHTTGQYDLWKWAWLAAILTGILVWGLIGYAVVRYRRRSDDEIPVQTRYNLPLEILYTLAPVVMVLVFFYFTVDQQNNLDDEVANPDHVVEVVGQQWSWTFNYVESDALDGETTVYQPGTPAVGGQSDPGPTLYLVVNESVRFNLHSPDVIHDFWITGFLMKMDVVPGRVNHFQITPQKLGSFKGKCAELCGVSHSRMLFNVEVVTREEFDAYLQDKEAQGDVSERPLLGGAEADTQAGLEELEEGESE
jgi:cytochrome c oxidase subunit 2